MENIFLLEPYSNVLNSEECQTKNHRYAVKFFYFFQSHFKKIVHFFKFCLPVPDICYTSIDYVPLYTPNEIYKCKPVALPYLLLSDFILYSCRYLSLILQPPECITLKISTRFYHKTSEFWLGRQYLKISMRGY